MFVALVCKERVSIGLFVNIPVARDAICYCHAEAYLIARCGVKLAYVLESRDDQPIACTSFVCSIDTISQTCSFSL
jgi:hypothetical protein